MEPFKFTREVQDDKRKLRKPSPLTFKHHLPMVNNSNTLMGK